MQALAVVFMMFWWFILFSKASLAACFMVYEHWSSVFEKNGHIYVTALYSLKTGCVSIFAYQAVKPTSKQLSTKQQSVCLSKCSSKFSSFDFDKPL